MSSYITVSIDEFYTYFPEFNTDDYTTIVTAALARAQVYIYLKNRGRLKDDKRKLAVYLMTAHLTALMYKTQSGEGTAGQVASASVGEVSVSYVQIPASDDEFEYWLGLTPYGLELLALLNTLTSVPFYIGGSCERVF